MFRDIKIIQILSKEMMNLREAHSDIRFWKFYI
jgi:hypothetical protein